MTREQVAFMERAAVAALAGEQPVSSTHDTLTAENVADRAWDIARAMLDRHPTLAIDAGIKERERAKSWRNAVVWSPVDGDSTRLNADAGPFRLAIRHRPEEDKVLQWLWFVCLLANPNGWLEAGRSGNPDNARKEAMDVAEGLL